MQRPDHNKKYSNRPSISDLPKKQESRKKDIKNLTLRGNSGSMQKFLRESDKIDHLKGKWRNLDLYRTENLWQQWRKSGEPSVRTWSKEEFAKSGNIMPEQSGRPGTGRAFYSQSKNRMTIRKDSFEDFFAELSHAAQFKGKDKSRRISIWDKYKSPLQRRIYGEEVYNMPSNLEYKAHKIIQPKMEDEYVSSSPLYGVEESKPKSLAIRR
tara:strand:+ start:43 stop:675 length:633 start_codon:yes stop_codon:yes gene_type:complete